MIINYFDDMCNIYDNFNRIRYMITVYQMRLVRSLKKYSLDLDELRYWFRIV